jgi:hypothetical protein
VCRLTFFVNLFLVAHTRSLDPRTGKHLSRVPVFEISSRNDAQKPRRWSTTALLHFRITGRSRSDKPLKDQPPPGQGFIIFTTHATSLRMSMCPPGAPDDLETFLKI